MSGNSYQQLYQMAVSMVGSRFEAGQLFAHVTTKRVQHLPFIGEKPATEAEEKLLHRMCEQRRSGLPLQYLLGEWEFYGLPLKVGRGVLIPRADTECLVDAALDLMKGKEAPQVLDLCTGTGCVAIAIAHERPDAAVTALEISAFAYEYLLKNIALNEVAVTPVKQDLNEYKHPRRVDILTCNPPYIPAATIAALQTELWFEPRRALAGGKDGLDFYHVISRLYHAQLQIGGWLCFEVGIGQSEQVSEILADNGYRNIAVSNDVAGVPRVVCGEA
jgi:release factor glutamine methyltransferase